MVLNVLFGAALVAINLLGTATYLAAVTAAKAPKKLGVSVLRVAINGEDLSLDPVQDLVLVEGDELLIKSAELNDPKFKADLVDLVGFQRPEPSPTADDRGVMIHTDRDMNLALAADKSAGIYRLIVSRWGKKLSETKVRVIKPELRYVAMNVNGKPRVLRPGEVTIVKGTDKFKVTEIATNIQQDEAKVTYNVKELATKIPGVQNMKFYELQFMRRGRIIARLPLQIEN